MLASENPGAGTVAAIGRTDVGHQEENAIRITMDDAGNRRVDVFTEGIFFFAFGVQAFVNHRDDRAA